MADQFQYLFTPLDIGPVTVRNRIMITAHATAYGDANPVCGEPGFYGERYAYYLAERAKGGAGLIYFGQVNIHPTSAYELVNASIGYDRAAIPGYKLATEMIHQHGAKVFIQFMHSGMNNSGEVSRLPVWAPSNVPGPGAIGRETPKAMEIEDIQEVIEYYGRCASYAKEGGFDGVEIHSTHSYLGQQFLSPLYNKRKDKYGGSLENRMRFLVEVLERIRNEIGRDMALGLRIPADELAPGGLTLDDMKVIARELEATGLIDFLNVSVGTIHAIHMVIGPMYIPHAYLIPLIAGIKEAVKDIPIFCIGRIVDPLEAEKILADGHADMIGMTRAHIADPEIGNKAKEGRVDDIRNCIGCCQGCIGHIISWHPVTCVQNPVVGKEKDWGIGTLKPAPKRKKVMVIGGGPAGLEAARVAAERGHAVTVYEKEKELGGQINLATKLPGRDEMEGIVRYRKIQLDKLGVKVVLGTEVTPNLVEQEAPDAVVVATGSTPIRTGFQGFTCAEIPGFDQDYVVVAEDIIADRTKPGNRVLIVDEDLHMKALGLADLLSEQGKQVEIITRALYVGPEVDLVTLSAVYQRTCSKGVKFTPLNFVKEILPGGSVIAYSVMTQEERKIEGIDTLVLVTGNQPEEALYFALKGKVKELYRIGDCVAPRKADRAIYEGHQVGRTL
jgi:mycofactocin system FadH/OYE family oxidoreductase 2